jgi:hypothetical protein
MAFPIPKSLRYHHHGSAGRGRVRIRSTGNVAALPAALLHDGATARMSTMPSDERTRHRTSCAPHPRGSTLLDLFRWSAGASTLHGRHRCANAIQFRPRDLHLVPPPWLPPDDETCVCVLGFFRLRLGANEARERELPHSDSKRGLGRRLTFWGIWIR